MGTYIVGTIVAVIIGLIIFKIFKDRKSGKGCGCGCESCSACPGCGEEHNHE